MRARVLDFNCKREEEEGKKIKGAIYGRERCLPLEPFDSFILSALSGRGRLNAGLLAAGCQVAP